MTHTSTEQERQAPIKMHPGDDLHLTVLMASHGLNFVTGKDREQLLAWGRDVWQAARRAPVAQVKDEQLSELRKDTARLDWMDAQVNNHPVYSGYSWQEVGYEDDRGLVCKIQTKKERTSVRKAIDTAMQKR